ncbi:MAG: MIP family channel protein [Myxococcota bacterium]|nr:MIP family channel protein [Myxococcota bacterium]
MNGKKLRLLKKVLAEFIGTYMLVFVGCGSIIVDTLHPGSLGHLGISFSFGLTVMVMIYATGHISGAHFNPAVTLAFALNRSFPKGEVLFYWTGQIIGAVTAAICLESLFGNIGDLGATLPHREVQTVLGLEIGLTFFLMFVITAVATDHRVEGSAAGLAIGSTVAAAALFGGPISGASMNPARSLGPALVSGNWEGLWLYLLAPCIGAVTAAFVYNFISCSTDEPESAAGCC